MHSIHANNQDRSYGYGFGWKIFSIRNGEIEEGHSGGVPGFLAQMYMHRNSKVGVIIFINERYQLPLFRGLVPLRSFSYKTIMKILFLKGENY